LSVRLISDRLAAWSTPRGGNKQPTSWQLVGQAGVQETFDNSSSRMAGGMSSLGIKLCNYVL
jgi:hypothetical protein